MSEAAASWYSSSGLTVLDEIQRASPDAAALFVEMENTLTQAVLGDLQAKATGREAEWCESVPALLQSPEWDVGATYAGELGLLRDLFMVVTGDAPLSPLPQAQALAPVASPSYQEVIASGINPENQFIRDEFRCYDESGADYSHPHLLVQITGPGQYLSSYGGGTFSLEDDDYSPDIEWLSGPLTGASSSLYFDDVGQRFYLSNVELGNDDYDYECYQQGPSERRALVEFRLKEPQPGVYECRDAATGEVQALELSAGSYRIGGASGTYGVTEVLSDDDTSRIEWLTGPFADEVSHYSEEAGNGFRDFSISLSNGEAYPGFVYSSSELALTCEGVGEPVNVEPYGGEAAPPPPGTEIGLEGFYYLMEYKLRGDVGGMAPTFYRFFPDGYVFIGTPEGDPNEIDCGRTKPNGAPLCATYHARGNFITVADEGEVDTLPFALDGTVPAIDGVTMNPVLPSPVNSLSGVYWYNYFSSSGFCGAFSTCSSTYYESNLDLRPDNTFTHFTDSQNLHSSDTALGSTSVSAYGNDADSGTYTVQGNVIEFRYNNGRVDKNFFYLIDPEYFMIGEQEYTLKDSE